MKTIEFSAYSELVDKKSGDCAKAIQKALEDIKLQMQECTLVFEKREYHIYKDFCEKRIYHTSNTDSLQYPEKTIGFLIENQTGLTIEGNGCEFIFHGDMMAFAVVNSKNISLLNFSWDFYNPTTSQIISKGSRGRTISYEAFTGCDFEVERGKIKWICGISPYTNDPYYVQYNYHESWCSVGYDSDTKIKRRFSFANSPFSRCCKIIKTGERTFDVKYLFFAPKPWKKAGMICEMCASKHRPTAGAFIWESENTYIENVHVHYLHGFGWLTQMSKNVTFKSCTFLPNKLGRRCTSYADLIHVSGASGKIHIENCKFSDPHDDPINIHGTFTRAEKRLNSNTLVLKYVHSQQGGFPQFHIGDEVIFYARDTLAPICGKEEVYTVTEAGLPGKDGNDQKSMTVSFDKPLPNEIEEKIISEPRYVAENITYTPEVLIKNCSFDNIPTRGILCTTRKPVIIEGNKFDHTAMASIFISNDSQDWYESGPVRDMTIRNNEFFIRETGQTEWSDTPAVYVHPVTKGGKVPTEPVHKNITIENNIIHLYHDKAFVIESVENLKIKNNKIICEVGHKGETFKLSNCKNVDSDLKQ